MVGLPRTYGDISKVVIWNRMDYDGQLSDRLSHANIYLLDAAKQDLVAKDIGDAKGIPAFEINYGEKYSFCYTTWHHVAF